MQSDLEYKLQNILLEKNDNNGPLISWKISTDIMKFTHSDKKERNPTLVGNIIVYMFDEQIEDLYAAAESHSNGFQNILDDTWVVSEKTDVNMFSKNLYEPHLSWSDPVLYLDGNSYKKACISGRIAILHKLHIHEENTIHKEIRFQLIKHLLHELMFYFNVDFVLTTSELFQNEVGELSENYDFNSSEIENEMLSIGFNRTGRSTLIIKLNMVNVNDYFTFLKRE
ncbi:hypothetical protein [Bacillus wiedmannii]|uniref:hypothetical protein n=1 Tax=Bacillus wiedmannii TaxID=1890302 RepID=UPI000B4418F6|nr:hypothetical protein BK740_00445 [Bacillus thuringiensis serovar argentinensis]